MVSGIIFARELISNVDKAVKRTYWTNQEIDKFFGKRSAKEIIKDGTTCYMNPCSDLNLVSSYILFINNLPHEWIIEEILPTKEFNFSRLHFILEFKEDNHFYSIDYKRNNEVYIFNGKYNGREDLQIKQTIRIQNHQINLEKSLYENINNSQLSNLLKNYSLEANLNRLKQDNYIENYERFKRIFGENFIIKQSQNPPLL